MQTAEATPSSNKPAPKNKSRNKKRRPQRTRGPRLDLSPPRFDVGDLAAVAGPPVWHSVHPAVVTDVTDAAVFVEVKPLIGDPVRAAVERKEWNEAPAIGAELQVRLGAAPSAVEQEVSPVATASWQQAEELAALEKVMAALHSKEPVEGIVVAEVKGGYSVALGGEDPDAPGIVRAFLPRSQATVVRGGAMPDIVGNVGKFDVVEVEIERANIVVGRKKRLMKERKARAKELLTNLEVGAKVTGIVRSVVQYGAFVDVGGLDGLLHMSDLSYERQPRVADVVSVGQEIDVVVLSIDKKAKKLKVGLKQLTPDPWDDSVGQLKQGAEVEGDVVALADFGAFIRISDGVEGLVHLSEISWTRVKHPSQKFKIGDRVRATVLGQDRGQRRLSLSTKALEANPYEQIRDKYPEGSLVTAKVKSLVDFGAFVELEDNIDGLIHNGELSWTQRIEHASEVLTIGDEVEIVVINVDVGRQRVSCSLKRVKDDPFQKWEKQFSRGSKHKLKIVRVVDAGVTVAMDEGLTGFVPRRELSTEEITRAQDAFKVGDEIEVEVKQFDRRTRRATLSAKSVIEGETKAAYDEYKRKERSGSDGRMTLGDALKNQLAGLSPSLGKPADDDAE